MIDKFYEIRIRNSDHDLLVKLVIKDDISISTDEFEAIVTHMLKHYKLGKIIGVYFNNEIYYGSKWIIDQVGPFNIPVSIESFSTLNKSTMIPTYKWFEDHILPKSQIIIIGRDVARPGYWLVNNQDLLNVMCYAEVKCSYSDALESI